MKSILKKIKGGLALGAVYGLWTIGGLGLGAGLATGGVYLSKDEEFQQGYVESEQVQEAVQGVLAEENTELQEQLENGEITESEFTELSKKINDVMYKRGLKKKVANDIFASDGEYQMKLKSNEQLKKASIALLASGASTLILSTLLFVTDVSDKLQRMGYKSIDEGQMLARKEEQEKQKILEEKQEKEQAKKYQEEIDSYTEEIAD